MGVSENSGTPKSSILIFHYKPSILGYHYFWKPPDLHLRYLEIWSRRVGFMTVHISPWLNDLRVRLMPEPLSSIFRWDQVPPMLVKSICTESLVYIFPKSNNMPSIFGSRWLKNRERNGLFSAIQGDRIHARFDSRVHWIHSDFQFYFHSSSTRTLNKYRHSTYLFIDMVYVFMIVSVWHMQVSVVLCSCWLCILCL